MSDLRELYQTVILDHNKNPRNATRPEGANRQARGNNPLCGDQLTVFVVLDDDDVVTDVGFVGEGCAISKASASLMTEAVKGKTLPEVEKLHDAFHEMATAPKDAPADSSALGKLAVFEGVREYPMRVKCATLSWHTLKAALEGGGTVTTE
jgi:nitrogen fixation NifU-like protein